MNISDAKGLLASLVQHAHGIEAELDPGRDSAVLTLFRSADPSDYVVVSVSGGWFELAVRGRFGTFMVDEDASDAEATAVLSSYVNAAFAYLDGRSTSIRTRVLRLPAIRIYADDGPIQLDLTVNDALATLVNPARRRARRMNRRSPSL